MTKMGMGILMVLMVSVYAVTATVTHASLPYGKIIFVDDDFTDEPSNHKWDTIQEAITDAEDGDIIFVFEGNYEENILVDKRVTLIGEREDGVTIDGNSRLYAVNLLSDGIIMENFTVTNGMEAGIYTEYENITIKNCTITDSHLYGIEIVSRNVTVLGCTIHGIDWGMMIYDSFNCTVRDTEIYDAENKSMVISSSKNITVEHTTIHDSFCGIWLLDTVNSRILESNMSDNIVGITVENSFNNTIAGCTFTDNFGYGIYAEHANTSEIINCEFVNNFGYGIYAEESYNNTIHHNNFVGNGINAYDTGANHWNSSIGNFWDDYTGSDGDGDGIGDTPYLVGTSSDYYPLMYPIETPPWFVWVDDDYDENTPGWNIDHFDEVQEALDAVKDGGTCHVYAGSYGGVDITKEVTIYGENAIVGKIRISADNVMMRGFESDEIHLLDVCNVFMADMEVSYENFGIYAVNVCNSSFYNLTLTNNLKGVYLLESSYNVFDTLQVEENEQCGFEIKFSHSNEILNCQIANNTGYGIYAETSSGNVIHHNNFVGNGINAYDTGANHWNSSIGNFWDDYTGSDGDGDGIGDTPYLVGTSSDYYPLMYPIETPPWFVWVDDDYDENTPGWNIDHFDEVQEALDAVKDGGTCHVYAGSYGGVDITKEVTIYGENAIVAGIQVSADNVSITGLWSANVFTGYAVKVDGDGFSARNCTFSNSYYGAKINGNNVTFDGCTFTNNALYGISIKYVAHVRALHCLIEKNNIGAIVENTDDVYFERTEISRNSYIGISLKGLVNNTFYHCIISQNMHGVYSTGSGNLFYLNDFIGNDLHVYDTGTNEWDNGSVGNYWDGYTGSDDNEDGIGDTPYTIDGDSIDHYPLIRRAGLPVAYFTYKPSMPYTVDQVQFNDTSIDFDGTIVAWLWDFGDGNTSTSEHPAHSYADDGIYTVNLTVTDNEGNTGSVERQIEVLNTPPVANFSWTPIKPTDMENVAFNGNMSADVDGIIVNYTWDFGDGNTSFGINTAHTYADNGNYTVTLTVMDDDGAVNWTAKEIMVVNVPPEADFTWEPQDISTSDTVHFSDASYDPDGSVVNYTWDFGDGTTGYRNNVTHCYADDGTYEVNLTVTDNDGAIAWKTHVIAVANVPPIAAFTWQPSQPTDVQKTTFNASGSTDSDGTVVNWTWDFGDGSTGYGETVQHRFADDGTYNVRLTVMDDDGATHWTMEEMVVMNVPPVASFSYEPVEPTSLDTLMFDDNSVDADGDVVNWTWSFGDGNVSYVRNPSHNYTEKGVYLITLTVRDDDGAEATVSHAVLIRNLPPVANFTWKPEEPTDVQTIIFTSHSYDEDGELVNYTWHFGNGNYAYTQNATYSYADNGTYTVVLAVWDDDGAKDEVEQKIEVKNVAPTAVFSAKPEKPRQEEKVTFDASASYDPDGSIVNYEWDFDSDGTVDAYGPQVEYRYGEKRNYMVTLMVTDNDGEKDDFQLLINVREKEKIPGFELVIIILASALLVGMRRYRRGIWRM